MLKSEENVPSVDQLFHPRIEALVRNAKRQGMSLDELLMIVMSWALRELDSGNQFSHGQAALFRDFKASIMREFETASLTLRQNEAKSAQQSSAL